VLGGARANRRARSEERYLSEAQRCITPHPNLPPQGGKGFFVKEF
jgi:hypothetical protein